MSKTISTARSGNCLAVFRSRAGVALLACATISLALASPARAATSADGYWADASSTRIASLGSRTSAPATPRALALNVAGLRSALAKAPAARAGLSGVQITLPMPDGSFARFEAFESQVMEPGLAAQFPSIKNYLIQGIDDPAASGRVNFTPAGFHGIVISAKQTVYIDPYRRGVTDVYVSYTRRDYYAGGTAGSFECGVTGTRDSQPLHREPGSVSRIANGDQLRSYRIAIAGTTEFTADQGGATAALASVADTVMRLNAIYERELAVHFDLVANNANIIYSGADPYSNGNPSALLAQNQANLDNPATIGGSGAYDIGHVIGTWPGGGSGLASLDSVCNNSLKARGSSSSSTPAGEPFIVDLMAHEIGHQFDANHTFNGTTGNCAAPNRNASTAWEPASGTTIMAYAGICGAENIQSSHDAYFHVGSLEEMLTWIGTNPTGSSCGTLTATGNVPPVPDAGPAYTIPVNTPFTLIGDATDANGDALTYTWEQFDLGTPSPPSTDDGSRPLFRSSQKVLDPTRTFPNFSDILTGNESLGESLPTTDRTLSFRFTARDNRAGAGGVDWDAVQLTSTTAAGPFMVTSLNNGGGVASGAATTITWNVAGTNAAPVNCASVDIDLSTDGGATFGTVLAAGVTNNGSATVTMPGITNSSARIRIGCSDNVFFDINDADFGIGTSLATVCDSPGLFLGEGTTASDSLTIAGGGSIIDVNVSVDASMSTFASTAGFALSHSGANVTLTTSNPDCQGNDIGVVFDDEAAIDVADACGGSPAIGGIVRPVGTLSSFDALDRAGTWTLNYNNFFSGCGPQPCAGTLNEWCVTTAVAFVGGGNVAPVLTAIGDQTVEEDATLVIPLSANDDDVGDTLSFSATNLPGFCTLTDNGNRTGSIDCAPAMGDANTYTVTVDVADDGTPSLMDQETFDIVVTVPSGLITACNSPNIAIPFNGTQPSVDDITIGDTDTIADLDVSLDAPHAWIGDLIVTLTHVETGMAVVLIDEPGNPDLGANGCDQADIDVVLDDEAATPAENQCSPTPPAMGGTLSPNNPLAGFDGESAAGTWRLSITDVFLGADDGTFQNWCVTITPAVGATDTDGDGVFDDTDNCRLVANPAQIDTNNDLIGNACDADLTGDCLINFGDLAQLKAGFNPVNNPDADFNGDGFVNFGDLAFMKQTFFNGAAPGPGPGAPGNACE